MVIEKRPEPTDDMRTTSTVAQAMKWLSGQEFNNVMLALILCALAGLAWYGTPALLSQIQAGYERMNEKHTRDLEQARQVFERNSDRDYQVIQSLLRDRGIDVPNSSRRPVASPAVE